MLSHTNVTAAQSPHLAPAPSGASSEETPSDSRGETTGESPGENSDESQGSSGGPRSGDPGLRALVIDDEASIRAALRRFFVRRGWGYDQAEDGQQGLELLLSDSVQYTVVVCDIRMPRMSGAELYNALVSQRPDLLPRLIFIAGDVTSPDVTSFLSRMDRPVLVKPFELEKLAQAIHSVRREVGEL